MISINKVYLSPRMNNQLNMEINFFQGNLCMNLTD